ncbi:MAG: hypothetical protein IPL97_12710 [Niastella sp.]|nr:hypothetical protein [Niastella sp.]
MKRILLIVSLILGSISFVSAQEPGDDATKVQKIQALYVAYITQQLKLTEAEAQKFWPVHSQYDAEIKAVGLGGNELDRQQSVLNIKKKYQDRFTKIIGADRTNDFYKTDSEFRKKMVERLKKLRQQGPNRRNNKWMN